MAPLTLDGLAHGMVSDDRIRLGNPAFTNVDGPMPTFAFSPGQVLHLGGLDSVVYGGHALGMTPGGRIPEFTHVGGPAPSFASGHGQAFRPKNLRLAAYDKLTLGMALSGHFHPGTLEFTHIKRLTLASNFCPGQALHLGSPDPMAGPCPKQCLHCQQDMVAEGAHDRRNHPPPCGPVTSNNAAI